MLVDTVDGMFLGGSGYQASNGKVVGVYSRAFAAQIELADYLKKKLQTTKTMLDRAPVQNEQGEIIGERILAVIFIKYVTEPKAILCTVLISTTGRNYMEFSTEYSEDSLDTVLAFEKYINAQR